MGGQLGGEAFLEDLVDDFMSVIEDAIDDEEAHLFCTNCFDVYTLPPGTLLTSLCGEERLRRANLDVKYEVCEECRDIRRAGRCPYCDSSFSNWNT